MNLMQEREDTFFCFKKPTDLSAARPFVPRLPDGPLDYATIYKALSDVDRVTRTAPVADKYKHRHRHKQRQTRTTVHAYFFAPQITTWARTRPTIFLAQSHT